MSVDGFAERVVQNDLAARRAACARDAQRLADAYSHLASGLADENRSTVPEGDSARAAADAQRLAQDLARLKGATEIADITHNPKES